MFASSKKSVGHVILASVLALGAVHCNLGQLGQQSTSSTTTTSTNVNEIPLQLQPEAAWTASGGAINPVCPGGANPRETAFTSVGSGVSIATESNRADCCTCAARSRSVAVAKSSTLGARLRGTLVLERGHNDLYSAASMRITLKNSGQTVGVAVVGENRVNDNCTGSSERPELPVDPSGAFDVDLEAIAPNQMFDEIAIDLNGYACGAATSSATLEEMRLAFVASSSAPAPAPVPVAPTPAPVAGTPDLDSVITPSQFRAYPSGTIGEDNSGIATITNHGTDVARGVTVDIHTESYNPYGPVAPFRAMDSRCLALGQNKNAYTCMLADMPAGATTTIAFTFNSFNQTSVVVIAKDSNGDVDFSDNRRVATVY